MDVARLGFSACLIWWWSIWSPHVQGIHHRYLGIDTLVNLDSLFQILFCCHPPPPIQPLD
jgi:hypothetical protein